MSILRNGNVTVSNLGVKGPHCGICPKGLVTNYREGGWGYKPGGGGGSEVLPLQKRGVCVLAMLKGRDRKFWGSF